MSQSSRWPKPLEPPISDLQLLVTTAHSEFARYNSSASQDETNSTASTTPDTIKTTTSSERTTRTALLSTICDIKTLLELLEEQRTNWWQDKSKQRQFWRETFQQDKITKINVVNSKTVDMIQGLKARLGTFCRWSLGLEDGVEELDGVGVKVESENVRAENNDVKAGNNDVKMED